MVRILVDQKHQDGKRYIVAAGLSSDPKPANAITGSKFIEVDTGREKRYDETGATWRDAEGAIPAAGVEF